MSKQKKKNKKKNILQWPGQLPDFNPKEHVFTVNENKTKGSKGPGKVPLQAVIDAFSFKYYNYCSLSKYISLLQMAVIPQ